MAPVHDFDPSEAFEVVLPAAQTLPFLFNSPHSGNRYPASFLAASRLDARAIRRSEDAFVDELFLSAVDHGAPLLRARFPRAWLDVNREPFELDPRMFRGPLPHYANIRSPRVSGGLGTIPRVVADTEEIYAAPLDVGEGLSRIETVYMPYHHALRRLLSDIHHRFGFAVLIDCHSMPSTVRGAGLRGRPDFVLGDRHGNSCAPALIDLLEAALTRRGYDISRNRPYAGGFITENYGRPDEGFHAIQIEINRALYLDERAQAKARGFDRLAADIAAVVGEIGPKCHSRLTPPAEAAE